MKTYRLYGTSGTNGIGNALDLLCEKEFVNDNAAIGDLMMEAFKELKLAYAVSFTIKRVEKNEEVLVL